MSFTPENPFLYLRSIWLGVVLTLLLVGVPGCAEKKGDVSGLVSFNGSPLPAGKITFICDGGDKPVFIADIRDGKYEIKGLPVGPVKITVATYKPSQAGERPPGLGPTQRPASGEAKPAQPEKYVAIPQRYGNVDGSNLTYDVKPGAQEHDIPLAPDRVSLDSGPGP